jgi:hypothetical protein
MTDCTSLMSSAGPVADQVSRFAFMASAMDG